MRVEVLCTASSGSGGGGSAKDEALEAPPLLAIYREAVVEARKGRYVKIRYMGGGRGSDAVDLDCLWPSRRPPY